MGRAFLKIFGAGAPRGSHFPRGRGGAGRASLLSTNAQDTLYRSTAILEYGRHIVSFVAWVREGNPTLEMPRFRKHLSAKVSPKAFYCLMFTVEYRSCWRLRWTKDRSSDFSKLPKTLPQETYVHPDHYSSRGKGYPAALHRLQH